MREELPRPSRTISCCEAVAAFFGLPHLIRFLCECLRLCLLGESFTVCTALPDVALPYAFEIRTALFLQGILHDLAWCVQNARLQLALCFIAAQLKPSKSQISTKSRTSRNRWTTLPALARTSSGFHSYVCPQSYEIRSTSSLSQDTT